MLGSELKEKEFPGLGRIVNIEEASKITGKAVNTLKVYAQHRRGNGVSTAIPCVYARMPWEPTQIKRMWFSVEILKEWNRQPSPRSGDLTEKMESLMAEAGLIEITENV